MTPPNFNESPGLIAARERCVAARNAYERAIERRKPEWMLQQLREWWRLATRDVAIATAAWLESIDK